MRQLLFDLDGTLTDPALGILSCYGHVLSTLGLAPWPDLELRKLIGPPLHQAMTQVLGSDDPELNARGIQLYRQRYATLGLYENHVYPGIPEVLAQLTQAGHRCVVVTSKAKVFADRIIDHFELRRYFAQVYGPELSGERSDKAELLGYALVHERLAPAEVCMIGDRRHDVVAAKAQGVVSLGVLWGYGSRQELQAAGADALVEQVTELPAVIRRVLVRSS